VTRRRGRTREQILIDLRKRHDTGNWKRKYWFAVCGEVASRESVDLSQDGLRNDKMKATSSSRSNSPVCLHQPAGIFCPLVVSQQIRTLHKTWSILNRWSVILKSESEIDGAASCTCNCLTSECHMILRLAAVRRIQCVGEHRSPGIGRQSGLFGRGRPWADECGVRRMCDIGWPT